MASTVSRPDRTEARKARPPCSPEHRPLEAGQRAARDVRCHRTAQRHRLQSAAAGEEEAAGRLAAGQRGGKGSLARCVEGDAGTLGEVGDALAPGDPVADRGDPGDAPAAREEQAFLSRAPDHAGEEGDIAGAVARRRDRLTAKVEAVEIARDWRRLAGGDHKLQNRRGGAPRRRQQ